MVGRILVGAGYGLRDWIAQRATAVLMAFYILVLVIVLLALAPSDFAAWRAVFSHGWMQFLTFLFWMSLCYHAWVGVRDIWMDYVKSTGLRLSLMVVTIAVLLGEAAWAVQILWRL